MRTGTQNVELEERILGKREENYPGKSVLCRKCTM